jgi:hypothetical protein
MEYINLHTSILDSAEFRAAEPFQQATWLKLLRYCVGQENGGVIHDCRSWQDRVWIQTAGVTTEDVAAACKLFWFDEQDLIVNFYPEEAEKQTKAMRKGGRIGNAKRWGKKKPESGGESGGDKGGNKPPESITKRNETEGNETEAENPPLPDGRNYPDVPTAIDQFKQTGADYTEEEIRGAWLNLTSRAVDGNWVSAGRTPRPVADWRVALESEIQNRRLIYGDKKNSARGAHERTEGEPPKPSTFTLTLSQMRGA